MTTPPPPRIVEFDGLVVEDAQGVRLLALPAALLPVLRSAAVIRYRLGDSVFNMRLNTFMDGRTGGQRVTQARDELAPRVEPPLPPGSAPTPQYGAPDIPTSPSPAPPPAAQEEQEDPANIPLRAKRGGEWTNIYVTRAQYDEYVKAGRISPELPTEEGQSTDDAQDER